MTSAEARRREESANAKCEEASESLRKARASLDGRVVAEFSALIDTERSPIVLRQKFNALKRAELEMQRMVVEANAEAEGVARKFRTKHFDLKRLQWENLKIVVYQSKKAMRPQPERDQWNQGGEATLTTFPGWVPLPQSEGGTRNLPPMWHRAQCYVCHNFFGPEGDYVPGTCSHPVHISCLLRMLHKATKCGSCRAPYHSRLWFQFGLEEKMDGAKLALQPPSTSSGGNGRGPSERLACALLNYCIMKYQKIHNDGVPMAEKRAAIDRFRAEARRRFADDRLMMADRTEGYNLRDEPLNLR
ncbi:hypothetical protein R1sor_000694 [Riccia sorocarpa]|uniref:RING-type domain-containing protein n=1 Tax=Riccia sorocarpa TaxID=122646 RepID=A0ABD3GWX7_9MARC